jgi:hypothetical protein
MTKTDQQAAIDWEENQSDYWYDNTPQNETYRVAFLAGAAHVRAEYQERDEKIRRDHEILVETMLTTFKAEKELIAREAFEAVKKLCYEIPHEEADRLLPAQSIAGDWAAETAIGIYTKIDKITFEDYKKSKGDV